MGEKKRLFLAVNLGVNTTRKIADAITKMRANAERRGLRVGWVPPANLHVTLKFLGEVDEARLTQIEKALRQVEVPRQALGRAAEDRSHRAEKASFCVEPGEALNSRQRYARFRRAQSCAEFRAAVGRNR